MLVRTREQEIMAVGGKIGMFAPEYVRVVRIQRCLPPCIRGNCGTLECYNTDKEHRDKKQHIHRFKDLRTSVPLAAVDWRPVLRRCDPQRG